MRMSSTQDLVTDSLPTYLYINLLFNKTKKCNIMFLHSTGLPETHERTLRTLFAFFSIDSTTHYSLTPTVNRTAYTQKTRLFITNGSINAVQSLRTVLK